jgi:hypothetical protein
MPISTDIVSIRYPGFGDCCRQARRMAKSYCWSDDERYQREMLERIGKRQIKKKEMG